MTPTPPGSAIRVEAARLLRGEPGEIGPIYTRLLATSPGGPNRGALLTTSEVYREVGELAAPEFPIWRSDDDGRNWTQVASVADVRFGVGNRYQPTLYELPRAFGGHPAGTILLAGNAIPRDLSSTSLVLYASTDGGITWEFVSDIDHGGPAIYDPGASSSTSAVWEPDLYLAGDDLVCVFADERWKTGRMLQVLVHRTTPDLRVWSDPILDFGVADSFTRPGMFVSTGELPDHRYAAVFEVVGPENAPIHFATSADGIHWGPPEDLGTELVSSDGVRLSGSPHIAWRVGATGDVELLVTGRTAIRSDGGLADVALHNADGGRGPWTAVPLPLGAARAPYPDNSGYSQSAAWAADGSLIHATTITNSVGSHDIVVARSTWPENRTAL